MLINELPLNLRFKMRFLAADVYTDKKPNIQLMELFMQSFLKQLKPLMEKGINIFNKKTGDTVKVFLLPLFFVLDSIARPIVFARVRFNGYYGCHWCYIVGESFLKNMRYDINQAKAAKLRTRKEYFEDVKKGEKDNCIISGVKGKCILH